MRIQGFHHLAVQVRDLTACAAFYADVVQLPELKRHHREDGSLRAIWMEVPGGGFLALEAATGAPAPSSFRTDEPGLLLLAFRIDRADRPALEEHLRARGVKVEHETRWTVYIRDPEGNRLAFSHHPHD